MNNSPTRNQSLDKTAAVVAYWIVIPQVTRYQVNIPSRIPAPPGDIIVRIPTVAAKGNENKVLIFKKLPDIEANK